MLFHCDAAGLANRAVRARRVLLGSVCLGVLAALLTRPASAVDGTWTGPGTEWTTGANWDSVPPATVPDGTATFTNNGAPTSLTISNSASIDIIAFTANAPQYSFAVTNGANFTIITDINSTVSPFLPAFTVNAGATLTVGDNTFFTIGSLADGIAGGGRVVIGPNAPSLLTIAGGTATTFSGAITGTGFLTIADPGTSLRLTGKANAIGGDLELCGCTDGGLTIDGGALSVGGLAIGVTVEGGTLAVINGGTLQTGLHLIVAANMIIDGPGSLATVAGITGITSLFEPGTLTISNGGRLVSQSGAAIDPGLAPVSAIVTGPGSRWDIGGIGLAVGGGGPGALTISNGGVVNTNVTLIGDAVDGSSAVLVTGPGSRLVATTGLLIGDPGCGCGPLVGTLTIANGGHVDSADTRIDVGSTLNLGNGGLAGTIATPAILNDGAIVANFTDTSTLSAAISGIGTLIKLGAGTLILTGASTYTGATNVNAGILIVNGSLTSTVSLNGGTLMGNGIIGGLVVNSGVVAPGNSIGTLTIAGNLTMGAASTYQAEVSPVAAVRSDLIDVAGTATVGGAVEAIPLVGSFRSQTYTILRAGGGVTGTFGSLIVNRTFTPGAGDARLSYDANNVYLQLDPAAISPQLTGAPRNPTAVAAAIDRAVLAGGVPPLAFDSLFNFSGQGLVAALTQLDGEVATGMQQAGFKALDLFLGAMLNPFLHGRGEIAGSGPALAFAPQASSLPRDAQAAYAAAMPVKAPPLAPASFGQRWSVWGSAYGGTSNTDGNASIASQDTRTNAYGFAAGVDHRLTPDTLVGFALAGGGTSWSLAGSLGSGRSDMFQTGVYGSHRFGAAYVSAAAAYTWHDASTNRNLTLAGVGQLDADFHAHSFGARLEGGYRWLTPFAGITPYGAAQVLSIRTPGYLETGLLGGAPFALAYNSQTTTSTRTELGLWFDRSLLLNPDAALTLRARAAWAHDFDDERDIVASFQTLPLAAFTVFGASPAQDYALLSGAAELRLRNGWSFALKGDAEVAGRTQTFSGNGTLRYAW